MVGLVTPRDAWWAGIWAIQNQTNQDALTPSLAGARKMTVTTVIAGQVKHTRTIVEQPVMAPDLSPSLVVLV